MKQKIKNIKPDSQVQEEKAFWGHCVVMMVLVLIVYWQYLTGQKTYVFMDVASDSAGQTYPGLVNLAREISTGNIMNRWNFVSSVGNSAGMILPKLANIEAYFGVEHVGYLMGLCVTIKVFLSGLFFYLYLRKMEISATTSSIFSLFYAFCAHMIIRGAWKSFPNEVLTFAIWLYAYEAWFRDGKNWWKLILASVFLYFNSSGYAVVLYTGVFIAYAVFRVIANWDNTEQSRVKLKMVLFLAGMIICSLLISSMGWLSSITTQVKSDRFSNGAGKLSSYDMSNLFTDLNTLKTAFYRTIGTDIIGISDFYGSGNFLEAPAFYCGILTIAILPAVFVQTKGIKKIAYGVGVVGVVLYILVKPVRFLANGFSGHTFKLASLWVMVLMLYIAATGFDALLESRAKHKTALLLTTSIAIGMIALIGAVDGINWLKLGITVGFLALYAIVLLCNTYEKINTMQAKRMMLLAAVVEVLFTSFGCVNNRKTMDENKYEDGTIEALEFAESQSDGDVFYRVDKNYQAVSYCDSLYQDYMGTVGYIGGGGDRKSTGEFYNAVSMPILGGNNHMMTGFWVSTPVNSVMNVRYVLSKAGMQTNFGYETLGVVDGITVYENQYALPLGYVYDKYMTLEEYLKLPVETRRNLLMEMCVLEDEDDNANLVKTEPKISALDMQPYEVHSEVEITENWVQIELPKYKKDTVNLVVMDVKSDGLKSSMIEYYNSNGDAVTAQLGFVDGREDYFLEFNDPQIERMQIFNTKQYEIQSIKLYQVPQKLYYKNYIDNYSILSANGLKVTKFDSNNIWGTLDSSKNGIMTFSIPYDVNWHVYIDDTEQELKPVNIAMMGTDITQGVHEVKLVYYKENTFWRYVSAGVVLFVLFAVITYVRKRKDVN